MLNLFRPHFLNLLVHLHIWFLIHYCLTWNLSPNLSIFRATSRLIGLIPARRKTVLIAALHHHTGARGWLTCLRLLHGKLGVLILHRCCALGGGIHPHGRPPRLRLLLLAHQPLQLRVIRMLLLQERYSSFLFSLVYDIVNHTVIGERLGFPFRTPILALTCLRFDGARFLVMQFMRSVWQWSILRERDGCCAVFWRLDTGRGEKFEFVGGAMVFRGRYFGFTTSVSLLCLWWTFFRFCSGWARWRPLPRVHIIYVTTFIYI